jgi:hypothetical protein
VVWDLAVVPAETVPPDEPLPPALVDAATTAVGGEVRASDMMRAVTGVDGVGVQTLTARPTGSDTEPGVQLALTDGRQPRAPGEIAIGPKTARDHHLHIGDQVAVDGLDSTSRVVGIALFPPEVHVGFDEGAYVGADDFDTIVAAQSAAAGASGNEVFVERWLALDLPSGADIDARSAQLAAALGDQAGVEPADTPIELSNLRNVRTLPVRTGRVPRRARRRVDGPRLRVVGAAPPT